MDQTIHIKNEPGVENNYIKIWKEEKLLYAKFSENLDMTLEIAKICVDARIKLSNGTSYPVLIDMSGIRSVTKEARDFMGKEGAQLITAGALIVRSPIARIIGNLFLLLNAPKVPTKLFTDEEDARKWLEQFNITKQKKLRQNEL